MRYSQSEKMQIIRLVDESAVSVKQTLFELNINRSTFYKWYHRYQEGGFDALANRYRPPQQFWNAIPPWEKQRVIEAAIGYIGIRDPMVLHRPRLLSDNGACYVSQALKEYLEQEGIAHPRGKPYHPMTQGKIERYHRSMKNILLLENYYSPDELTDQIALFIEYYNNHRYHEALNNLTPVDVYYGNGREILTRRERIKKKTMIQRRRYNCSLKVA